LRAAAGFFLFERQQLREHFARGLVTEDSAGTVIECVGNRIELALRKPIGSESIDTIKYPKVVVLGAI
jgi:hypothetical protein